VQTPGSEGRTPAEESYRQRAKSVQRSGQWAIASKAMDGGVAASGNSGQKIFHMERIQAGYMDVVREIIKFIIGEGKQ
jgi:hypothetical protein